MTRPHLDVEAVFPEVELIQSEDLRQKVVAVWQEAWAQSSFERIEDLPIGPKIPHSHVPHNRAVVTMAVAMADAIERFHGVEVDRDALVAAALLQDASKLVEMRPAEGGVEQTEIGRSFQHAFWACHKALEHGVPLPICEIVLNHTPDAPQLPHTLEGKILWYADQLDVIAVFSDRWVKHLFLTR
jgi:HD domain-containing protein